MLFKQLAGKSARCISRLILTHEFLFSFVWIVGLRFSAHSPQMHDAPIRACDRLHHANSRQMRVSCIDLIFHSGSLLLPGNRSMQYLTYHGRAGERGAHITDCDAYRYRLRCEWDRRGTQQVRAAIRYSDGGATVHGYFVVAWRLTSRCWVNS